MVHKSYNIRGNAFIYVCLVAFARLCITGQRTRNVAVLWRSSHNIHAPLHPISHQDLDDSQGRSHRSTLLDCAWNVMAHAQKPDFVFRRNGRVHLNRKGRQFSRLVAAEVCASAVVMLDTPCSEVVWRVLATHSIRQFPLHFPSRASPCALTFRLDSSKLLFSPKICCNSPFLTAEKVKQTTNPKHI